ncbi:MAG: S8 family serine peptidase [Nitrospirota bacterium]
MRNLKLSKTTVSFVTLLFAVIVLVPLSVSAGELSASHKNKVAATGGYEKLAAQADRRGSVRIIVKVDAVFRPTSSLTETEAAVQQSAIARAQERVMGQLASVNVISHYKYQFIPYIAMTVDRNALDAVLAIAEVTSVEEDELSNHKQVNWDITKVGAPAAWSSGYDGTGYTVAILDTGVDKTHPILTGKVVSEACYSSNDSASFASSVCSGGVTDSTSSGSAMPYVGNCPTGECDHGTHVAGTAAGQNTGQSSGVAKGANIIAIQVFTRFDDNSTCDGASPCTLTYSSDQIKGLERVYALIGTYSIASANMSLGGGKYTANCDSSNASRKAAIDNLRSAGIATVISSGNSGYTNAIGAPGCISTAVSVGATDSSDAVASYSNSANMLNLLAPGSDVTSSIPNGGYASWNGTSMAAPHVAGAWAVLKQAKPTASVSDILTVLTNTGVSVTDSRNTITKPRIQVDTALNSLLNTTTLTVTKSGTGTGTVTSSPAGISCGSTCSATFTSGTSITLTTAADSGSSVTSWSGCDSSSGSQCTVTMSANKSVSVVISISDTNYSAASAWINAVASQYSTYFGTKSGAITTGTDAGGTYYSQWFTNGTAILAYSDGIIYFYTGTSGSGWNSSLGLLWNESIRAAAWINAFYNQYPSFFGTKSGVVTTGTDTSGTYYIQFFTNGTGLMAWTDGYVYFYSDGKWNSFGTKWK